MLETEDENEKLDTVKLPHDNQHEKDSQVYYITYLTTTYVPI
jgi:hypothetical protein